LCKVNFKICQCQIVISFKTTKKLSDCRIDHRYATLIERVYQNATASVRLHDQTERFRIEKRVRQGDTISPKLFAGVCFQEN